MLLPLLPSHAAPRPRRRRRGLGAAAGAVPAAPYAPGGGAGTGNGERGGAAEVEKDGTFLGEYMVDEDLNPGLKDIERFKK